eukprot:1156631-Pelagomonas_calceolata.AAC.3
MVCRASFAQSGLKSLVCRAWFAQSGLQSLVCRVGDNAACQCTGQQAGVPGATNGSVAICKPLECTQRRVRCAELVTALCANALGSGLAFQAPQMAVWPYVSP